MVSTVFGSATVVEQINVKQTADGKTFNTLVELLETEDGEALVRIAYATDGVVRRGPVTVRKADLRRIAKALARTPKLRAVIEGELSSGGGES